MTTDPTCPVPNPGEQDPQLPEHEAHRNGKTPKVKVSKKLSARLSLAPTIVGGISLTDYSRNAQQKGWGAPCTQARTAITLSNGVRFTVATRIALLTTLVMNECIRRGYVIRQNDTGAYNCRYIAGTTVWSNHAWAIAIDINWTTNPYTTARVTDKPQWLFDLFNRFGFANGADYSGRKDWMHHEFMGSPTQADAATSLALKELGGDKPPVVVTPPPASSSQITQDQFDLNDTGFPCLLTGIWDAQSQNACRRFQTAAKITVDGICGPVTRTNLHKVPSWHSSGPNVADDPGGYSASQWQQKLADHGWHIVVDNQWGAHSKSILTQFQADKGISVDGNRGPQSWTCLYCTVN